MSPNEPIRDETDSLPVSVSRAEEIPMEDMDGNGDDDEEERGPGPPPGRDQDVNPSGNGGANNLNEDLDAQPPFPPPIRMEFGRPILDRPWWIWFIGIIDIALVFIIMSWTSSDSGTQGDGTADPEPEELERKKLTFTNALINISHLIQFMMGIMIIVARCIPNDSVLLLCLRGYLYGSYFLIGKITFVIVSSLMITTKSERYSYEWWQRVVSNMLSMFFRLPETMVVQDFLKRYIGPFPLLEGVPNEYPGIPGYAQQV